MKIQGLPNGRDLAGTTTPMGIVRPGLLLRSAAPTTLDHADAIVDLAIGHVIDLRTDQERARDRVSIPQEVIVVTADVLADATYAGAANLGKLAALALQDGAGADRLAARDLGAIMVDSYRDFARLSSARLAIRQTLELLASDDAGPVLIHCTAGKDRTGWVVAVVLRILGASWDDILADYLLSGPAVQELFAEYLDSLPPELRNGEALAPVLGVSPKYLDAARQWCELAYPSFDGYVREGLGVGDHTVAALRERLIQSSSDSTLT